MHACALGLLVDECTIHMLSGRGKKLGLLRANALWTVRRQTLRSNAHTAVSQIGFKQPTILTTQICCESEVTAEGRKYTVESTLSVGWDLSLLSSTIPCPNIQYNLGRTPWQSEFSFRVQVRLQKCSIPYSALFYPASLFYAGWLFSSTLVDTSSHIPFPCKTFSYMCDDDDFFSVPQCS